MPRPNVLCFGEILWDCLPEGRFLGGAPLNVSYHLAQLGCAAWPVSSVGDDALGRELLDRLQGWQLLTELIGVHPTAATGTVEVSLDDGQPTFDIVNDVAWDYIALPGELPQQCEPVDAVLFGSLAERSATNRESLQELLHAAPQALKVFDVNLRPPHDDLARVRALASNADLIKINDDEAAALLGIDSPLQDFEAAARAVAEQLDCESVCLTGGSIGAGLLHHGEWHWVAAVPVTVRDTIGAGDAFLATLIHGLLTAPQASSATLQRAAAIASFVAGCDGATPAYQPEDFA
ncbi:MAG: carbohydrate kinase family protein [Woeseiaceae bacterium]